MDQLSEIIVFSNIQNEEAAKTTLDLVLDNVGRGGRGKQFNKTKTHQFLTVMNNHLTSNQSSAKSKFYTLHILKEATERGENKILSVISTHNLLKYLSRMAKQTDPNKSMNEKGRTLFDDKQLGNDYIRLILETLKVWGQKFKTNKQQQPTKFRKVYDELNQLRIVMPSQLKFYNTSLLGSARQTDRKTATNQYEVPQSERVGSVKSNAKESAKGGSQFKKDMDYSVEKVNNFIQILNTEEDYQKSCHTYHKMFTKQIQKYQNIINSLAVSGDQKGVQRAIALNDFFIQQANAYKQFLTNKDDYYSYVNQIRLKASLLGTPTQSSPTPRTKQQVETRRNNHINQNGAENKELVSKLMDKLNDKSKSPTVGFRAIKQSLSKDKSLGKSKRSVSGLKKSSVSKFGKSMSISRIAEIFSTPPNPYPRDKRYQGQLIQRNKQLDNVMRNLSRHQGIRRFITCNFKPKNPLFQNTHLQIGVKSQPIYEQVNDFKVLINIELYIGNKTDDLIKNISIEFKGNSDVLLYGNPRTVESILEGGYQSKQQLLVIPLNYHFPLIKMHLKYNINGETVYQEITMPNSILKLASNGKLSKKQFVQHWNASTIFRTNQFKLTRYITPDTLNKYITCLEELSSYSQFLIKGSETDFQLGCQVILKQRYEGVLRISVRPNLNVVIQIGISDNNQQAHQSFIFYAQTLQTILTHVDHQL